MFVHTYSAVCGTIILVKPPPIHYIVFATPHKKEEIPSPKKTADRLAVFFAVQGKYYHRRKEHGSEQRAEGAAGALQ